MSSVLKYFGGKHYQATDIATLILKYDFKTYVEAFFGAGHVLFELLKYSKAKHFSVICNDLSRLVYSFWKVIADEELSGQLYEKLSITPYAVDVLRDAFAKNTTIDNTELTPDKLVENAFNLFIGTRLSFSGIVNARGLGYDLNTGRSQNLMAFRAAIKQIPFYHKLIANCQILNNDVFSLIELWRDKDYVLWYADPPYYNIDKSKLEGYLINQQDLNWHQRLIEAFSSVKGVVLMSYQEEPMIEEIFKSCKVWRRGLTKTHNSRSSRQGRSGNVHVYNELVYIKEKA